MGIMKGINQYLKLRGSHWHYVRRVPSACQRYDNRGCIQRSLETESLEVARVRRNAMSEADQQHWAQLRALDGDSHETDVVREAYRVAVSRSMAKGFIYTPVHQLADTASVVELVERIKSIPAAPVPDKLDADSVLGTIEQPKVSVTETLDLYFSEIAIKELVGKSESQIKSWRKVKLRAVSNFVRLNGNLNMDEITREHARAFYNWWSVRVLPKGNTKPLSPNSANRDLGNMRKLYRKYWEYEGDEIRPNPFRNLNFGSEQVTDVPHFDRSWFVDTLIKPNVLDGLNPEAILIVYALVETGCRPSEAANLLPENIVLDAPVPHIQIRSQTNRILPPYNCSTNFVIL